ncbi:MAG: hypothetical protein JXL80_05715 [Planctomycetes bacterium]|nr:hypothetical protein [Planctomycetota bacterium]
MAKTQNEAKTEAEITQDGKEESKGLCFVLMPFDDVFNIYYTEIICPAVKAAGLTPKRADSLFRSSGIMNDIWQWIRDAKVLLAVLTDRNPNVFYELGLAHAIGKSVILVSKTMDDVPFDLRSYRVQLYEPLLPKWDVDFQDRITKGLTETLDNPAAAVPSMFAKIVPSEAPERTEIDIRLEEIENRLEQVGAPRGGDLLGPLELCRLLRANGAPPEMVSEIVQKNLSYILDHYRCRGIS